MHSIVLWDVVGEQQIENRPKEAALRYSSTNLFEVRVFFAMFNVEVTVAEYERRICLIYIV